MIIRFERPTSLSAVWARRLGLISLVMTIAAWAAHRFGPLVTPHLIIFLFAASLLAILAVLLALIGFARLWQVGAKGGKASFIALLAVILPLSVFGFVVYQYIRKPAIYDVSTDITDVPQWLILPQTDQYPLPPRRPIENQDRALQIKAYPGLSGRRYEGAIDRVLQAVRQVSEERHIRFVKESGLRTSIAAVEPDGEAMPDDLGASPTTGAAPVPTARPKDVVPLPEEIAGADVLLQGDVKDSITGFKFDVLIRLREESETTLVDIRVASRYGPHDLGLGAVVADSFLKKLDAVLLGLSGN